MREYEFRGKRVDNGEWVYGGISFQHNKAFIYTDDLPYDNTVEIDPATVGQYIGRKDKNNKKVWEGDLVRCRDSYEPLTFQGKVSFDNASFFVKTDTGGHYRWMDYEVEVIGNIFDNIEPLEVTP